MRGVCGAGIGAVAPALAASQQWVSNASCAWRSQPGRCFRPLPRPESAVIPHRSRLALRSQEEGFDTVDANRQLGLPDDAREYSSVLNILKDLDVKSIKLIVRPPLPPAVLPRPKLSQRWAMCCSCPPVRRAQGGLREPCTAMRASEVCSSIVQGRSVDTCMCAQTNNPRKIRLLEELGLIVEGRIPCLVQPGEFSKGYLEAKGKRMDHLDLDGDFCYWDHAGEKDAPHPVQPVDEQRF